MSRSKTAPERLPEPAEEPRQYCPVCGAEGPRQIIQEPGGAVLGCDACLCLYSAWEWFDRQESGAEE